MVHGKFEEVSAAAEPKKKGRTEISEERSGAPSIYLQAAPQKRQPAPEPEKATSPTPTPSPTPANDSLDALMHVPSSLKLNPPAETSPLPSSLSPTATPDTSPQLAPASSRLRLSSKVGRRLEIKGQSQFQLALSHSCGNIVA